MPSNPANSKFRDAYEAYQPNFGRPFVTPGRVSIIVKDLELEDMMAAGIVDQMDTLGMIVQEKTDKAQGKTRGQGYKEKSKTKAQLAKEADAEAVSSMQAMGWMKDPVKFDAISRMLNKVIVACVLEPVFESPYIGGGEDDGFDERKRTKEERLEGALYADYVPIADKMAIFGEVFKGLGDLEPFREGSDEAVGDMADEPESSEKPQ